MRWNGVEGRLVMWGGGHHLTINFQKKYVSLHSQKVSVICVFSSSFRDIILGMLSQYYYCIDTDTILNLVLYTKIYQLVYQNCDLSFG